jgi:flagellar hook-associated protein 2
LSSAPITFSGFNNVDFNMVLTSLMQVASQPLTALQGRQSDLQAQITTYGTLTSRLQSLDDAADDLHAPGGLSAFSATSSDAAALGASAAGALAAGHYDVVVNELARAQVTVSASASPDADTTVVASGGSITIGGVAVAIGGDVTLAGLAEAINGTDGIGVQAAVVRTSATTWRLALTSTLTGAEHAFTVTNGLTGGAGVTFADTDQNGITGDSAADNAVTATDASLLVNNIAVTSASNTIADAIPGVTFTAYRKDPATTIGVDVASDSSAVTDKLRTFIDAYNDLAKFVGDQRAAALKGETNNIGRDPLLRQISGSLRATLLDAHGAETFTRLSAIGVTFTQAGTMALDDDQLAEALESDPDAVRGLIGGDTGAFAAVESLVTAYAQTNGFIATVKDHLTSQVKAMGTQIEQLQARLALQRDAMQKEFIQADLAMSQLKSQATSLASFGDGLGSL